MKWIKIIGKVLFTLVSIIMLYGIIAMGCSYISTGEVTPDPASHTTIYIHSNGVHLDIILPIQDMSDPTLEGLVHTINDRYLSFGWGDENFYINTPRWGDLTFGNAFSALFLKSTTLMHLTRYTAVQTDWVAIRVTQQQLQDIENYIQDSFQLDVTQQKIKLSNKGYGTTDDFYKARGSYSCFKTCNTWVNTGLKKSTIKACLWTPFDFGVLRVHQEE